MGFVKITDSLRHLLSLEIVELTKKITSDCWNYSAVPKQSRIYEFSISLRRDHNKNGSCVALPSERAFTIRTSTVLLPDNWILSRNTII